MINQMVMIQVTLNIIQREMIKLMLQIKVIPIQLVINKLILKLI